MMRNTLLARVALALWLSLAAARPVTAASPPQIPPDAIFVDPQIAEQRSDQYDPAKRTCGAGGARRVFRTLAAAAAAATTPGATVILRAGVYGEALAPRISGEAGKPITFRNFPGEEPTITGEKLAPAINLSGRSNIVIEGLRIDGVRMWLHALKSTDNVIIGNRFTRAICPGGSAKAGAFFQQGGGNRIVDNTFEACDSDSLALIRSDGNLVENNTFRNARHVLWTIKGGSRNVLRGNRFHNEWQKIGEVYDCDHVGFDHEFTADDCTKRNVIEENEFSFTPSSGNHSPFAGIQYAGQDGIIRRNVFHHTVGPALDLTLYPPEARFNTGNRIYHNVFARTDFAGIVLAGGGGEARGPVAYHFADNVLKNNVLVRSAFVANDTRWPWYTKELSGRPVQLMAATLGGFLFERNVLFGGEGDGRHLVVVGQRDLKTQAAPQPLAGWQTAHPELFKDNSEFDPQFVDEAKADFRPAAGSKLIDAGAFLTTAVGAGAGTELPVADARYFSDGLGIAGQVGDLVQLEGETVPVRVTAVDLKTNILRLERAVTRKDGQGVSMAFRGARPDIGRFEGEKP